MKINVISVASWGANRLDIFGLGGDNQMYHKAWDGNNWWPSLTDWEALGGFFNPMIGKTFNHLIKSNQSVHLSGPIVFPDTAFL